MSQKLITFDAFDLCYIAMFAERQSCVKRANRTHSYKHDVSKTEFELHYIGAMGEYAVSKYFGVPMDTTIHAGGDNGVDMNINGWPCHIKTFTYAGPNIEFYMDGLDHFTAPVGIFTKVCSPIKVMLCGCISRKTFIEKHKIKNYNYGDRVMVTMSDIEDVDILLNERKPDPETNPAGL